MSATFNAITTGELDQDSPVTQPLITKLRDNAQAVGFGTDKIEETPVSRGASTSFENTTDAVRWVGGYVTFSTAAEIRIEFSPDGSTWTDVGRVGSGSAPSFFGFPLPVGWYWRWRYISGSGALLYQGGLTDG